MNLKRIFATKRHKKLEISRIYLSIFVLLVAASVCFANSRPGKRVSFNQDWRFQLGDGPFQHGGQFLHLGSRGHVLRVDAVAVRGQDVNVDGSGRQMAITARAA